MHPGASICIAQWGDLSPRLQLPLVFCDAVLLRVSSEWPLSMVGFAVSPTPGFVSHTNHVRTWFISLTSFAPRGENSVLAGCLTEKSWYVILSETRNARERTLGNLIPSD